MKTGELEKIAESEFGFQVADHNKKHSKILLATGYTVGDAVLYYEAKGERTLLYGVPMDNRKEETVPLNGLTFAVFAPSGKGVIVTSSVFEDTYSLGYIDLKKPGQLEPVKLKGIQHEGAGELEEIDRLQDDRYLLVFNIDGCSLGL